MDGAARNSFHDDLSRYIQDPNTSEKLKVHWANLHNESEEE